MRTMAYRVYIGVLLFLLQNRTGPCLMRLRQGLLQTLNQVTIISKSGYLGGQRDLVSGLIMGITRVTIWIIGVIILLTKSP